MQKRPQRVSTGGVVMRLDLSYQLMSLFSRPTVIHLGHLLVDVPTRDGILLR